MFSAAFSVPGLCRIAAAVAGGAFGQLLQKSAVASTEEDRMGNLARANLQQMADDRDLDAMVHGMGLTFQAGGGVVDGLALLQIPAAGAVDARQTYAAAGLHTAAAAAEVDREGVDGMQQCVRLPRVYLPSMFG